MKRHIEQGGRLASKWTAFGSGAACLAALFGVIFFAEFANDSSKVMIGSKDEVSYSGSATKQDAQALGNALKTSGYFTDRGVSVSLTKGKEGTIASFVTKEGAWDQPGIVSSFEEIGREIAPAIGGLPIHVRLTNKVGDIKSNSIVGSVTSAGGDTVYYLGSATQTETQALVQALKSERFFKGRGADVFLSKHADGTVLSFVVGPGVWNDSAVVGDFERIVRQAASTVGGLPIRLRLVTSTLEMKKEELVH